jgi:hypothetical protein
LDRSAVINFINLNYFDYPDYIIYRNNYPDHYDYIFHDFRVRLYSACGGDRDGEPGDKHPQSDAIPEQPR